MTETSVPDSPFGELLEDIHAPEMYAFSAISFSSAGGVITIVLTSTRVDLSSKTPVRRQVVVGRLSMPIGGARGMALGLVNFINTNPGLLLPEESRPKVIQ